MSRPRLVHVAAGPHGTLRAFRSVWAMYVRIVFDGARPEWAAMAAMQARTLRPSSDPDGVIALIAGYSMVGRFRYQARVVHP